MRGENIKGHTALRLRHDEGMSLRQIAALLGMTTGAVCNAMKRAVPRQQASRDFLAERHAQEARIDARRVMRDPCLHCAVPRDRHDEHGCRRYVPA